MCIYVYIQHFFLSFFFAAYFLEMFSAIYLLFGGRQKNHTDDVEDSKAHKNSYNKYNILAINRLQKNQKTVSLPFAVTVYIQNIHTYKYSH